MLHKKFSNLDKDYIILNSKYLVDNNNELYFKKIEKLAEFGQINAIQDFYKLRDEVKGNGYVNEKVEEYVSHFIDDYYINFEEAYALLLRNKNFEGKKYVFDVVNEELNRQFFNDKFAACIVSERALEIYHDLNGSEDIKAKTNIKNIRGVVKEGLNDFKHEDLNGDKDDIMRYITTRYSLRFVKNKSRNQVQQCYGNLIRLSNKPLSQSYEDENG